MFDKEKAGFIEVSDLQTIMRSLGRDPSEVIDLMQSLDINTNSDDGTCRINFEEFLKLMKNLENRLISNGGNEETEELSPREASLDERTKYGSLLPRTGVHFLPDPKVIDFLK
jgi:Ca2+-binding EF-hand superfamily protein